MYNTKSEIQILSRYQFGFLIAIISIIIVANPLSDLFAQSTTSISGSVIDSDTQKPLAGANVFIEKSGVGASTDTEGRFLIPSVSDGIYILTCSYIGYEKESITLTIRNGQSPFVEFRITAKVLEFPQISVIGIGRASLQRIPGSGTLISSARLLNTKPLSGNEILRQVPGVHVQEEEGLGLRANISIRGLNPDRSRTVLMLEDGVPVALAPYGEPEMYYTPPIDRMSGIEIVKGSGSILFGPQTVGGVINYITVNPRLAPEGRLIFRGGQNGLFVAQGQFTKNMTTRLCS